MNINLLLGLGIVGGIIYLVNKAGDNVNPASRDNFINRGLTRVISDNAAPDGTTKSFGELLFEWTRPDDAASLARAGIRKFGNGKISEVPGT